MTQKGFKDKDVSGGGAGKICIRVVKVLDKRIPIEQWSMEAKVAEKR